MPLDNAADNSAEYQNHIPAAVRRAGALADELAARQHEPEEGADPQATTIATVVEAPADPAVPAAEPAPVPTEPAATIDWEQRFRTLQGKYDAEIPRLTQDAASKRNEAESLRQLLANLQAAPRAPEPAPTTIATVVIPDADKAEFGEDLIAATQRWALARVQPELDALRREMAQLRGGQQEIKTETSQQKLEAGLSANPELGAGVWQQVNDDPKFMAWLNQADPFAGQPRLQLFSDAAGRCDVDRVARFFTAYLREHTAPTQSSAPAPAQTPTAPQPVASRPTLEALAAPGRAPGAAPNSGAPGEKRVWTQPEIARFYDDKTKGRFAGRDDEFRRLELDIFAAMSEGRVRS